MSVRGLDNETKTKKTGGPLGRGLQDAAGEAPGLGPARSLRERGPAPIPRQDGGRAVRVFFLGNIC